MVYKEFTSRKQKLVVLFWTITALVLMASVPVAAQQTTGQVAPKTRNPQGTITAPLQRQTNEVQSTSGEQLLRQDQMIQIPSGAGESEPDHTDNDNGNGLFWLMLALAGAGVLTSIIAISKLNGKNVEIQEYKPIAASKTKNRISEKQKTPTVKRAPKKKKRPANRPQKKRKKK